MHSPSGAFRAPTNTQQLTLFLVRVPISPAPLGARRPSMDLFSPPGTSPPRRVSFRHRVVRSSAGKRSERDGKASAAGRGVPCKWRPGPPASPKG